MTLAEITARAEGKLRNLIVKLPPHTVSYIYSNARKLFLSLLSGEYIPERIIIPDNYRVKLWGLEFQSPLFNAAGMFKYGDGYRITAMQGAGAFLAGTTTHFPRLGNKKNNIKHPFMPYPNSLASSNWMGLPNPGHDVVARRLSQFDMVKDCPIGASIAASPEQTSIDAAEGIISGLHLYNRAGVDFIELNESCPNVEHHGSSNANPLDSGLIERLEHISKTFLANRNRNLPVIVKFSNDTSETQVSSVIDILLDLGFDGVNFGNTSIQYEKYARTLHPSDMKNFRYFSEEFGGGLSGRILKGNSLNLCSLAAKHLASKNLRNEFHIIRTGGVEDSNDIYESSVSGIKLNQWFAGYFDNFGKYGHSLYRHIFGN
jgi:dihydroorotate dehydrogenase